MIPGEMGSVVESHICGTLWNINYARYRTAKKARELRVENPTKKCNRKEPREREKSHDRHRDTVEGTVEAESLACDRYVPGFR